MAGLHVELDIAGKLNALAGGFDVLTDQQFARMVQFSLNGVGIDGVNRWRREARSGLFDRPTDWIVDLGVRYDVDRAHLASIQSVGEAFATIRVNPAQSSVLKYAFGEGHRAGGDVGMEAWFPDQSQVYLPVETNLARYAGIHPNGLGNYSGKQVKALSQQMAAGYQRNVTVRSGWAPFEIRTGAPDPAKLGVGMHMRPPRGLATDHRERLKAKIKRGKATAPRTQFTAAGGRQVDVPKVVNLDIPRLVFLTKREGVEYKDYATPSWEKAMHEAADTLPGRMADQLADKLEHIVFKALGGR